MAVGEAQVMWNLKATGMLRKSYDDLSSYRNDSRRNTIDWGAGLELEIPIKGRLSIETGLMYKNHLVLSFDKDWENKSGMVHYDHGFLDCLRVSFLELPVRLTWNQHIHRRISTHIGFGPYVSYGFGNFTVNSGNKGGVEVGLQPSVAFYFRNFNIGASYNFPIYHNYHDKNKPAIMLTMGIRFKSSAWKYVGATALVVGTVGLGALAIAGMSKSSDSSSYSGDSSSNSSRSSRSKGDSGGLSEQNSYNTDKATYSRYDSLLSSAFAGNSSASLSEIRDWQSKMKKLRQKWESKGKSFPHSSNEDR